MDVHVVYSYIWGGGGDDTVEIQAVYANRSDAEAHAAELAAKGPDDVCVERHEVLTARR